MAKGATVTHAHYEVDVTARADWYFAKALKYRDICWSDFDAVLGAFRRRMEDWFLDPAKELAKNGHFAFSIMALNCLMIETLGQFRFNKQGRSVFKNFIKQYLPEYKVHLNAQIRYWKLRGSQLEEDTTKSVIAVLYHAFRCGILHQSHISPYGGIDPDRYHPRFREVANGGVKYRDTKMPCPVIVINPLTMLTDLESAFGKFLSELGKRENNEIRSNFKSRFDICFGINIDSAQ